MEQKETEQVVQQEQEQVNSNEVDYERLTNYINGQVEKEIGKFIKTFIENNGKDKNETISNDSENKENSEKGELDSWVI